MKPESALLSKRVLACLGAFFGLTVSTLYGATITWTNTSGGVWSSAINWSPNIVPRGSDTVQITAAGTYTVTVDTSVAILGLTLGGASGTQTLTNNTQTIGITNSCLVGADGILNLGGGTLSGGLLTLQGMFNWVSGTVAGPLTVASGGVLNITGNVSLQNVLTNAVTVTMSGAANLAVFNNTNTYHGGVYNLAAALWDLQTNATIQCEYCVGNEFFNNAGTLRKSGGPGGTAIITVPFANTATVDALAGILSFSGAFTNAGGTLAFGVSSLASFGQINISGNVALNGTASATWLNGYTPAVGNSFALLDYGSHTGTFATISLPAGSFGVGIYGATVFSLMITNATAQTNNLPVFLSIKLVNTSNAVISWPSSATNYSLQTTTNLAAGSWSNVTSGITMVSTNDVLTNNVNGKAGFFRLRSP